jgi:hypothetical protein
MDTGFVVAECTREVTIPHEAHAPMPPGRGHS